MRLQEIFLKLLGKGGKFEEDQTALGTALGIGQSTVSNIKNGGAPEWESHWQMFLKLLPLLAESDLITERDLQGHRRHEPATDSSRIEASKTKISVRKKVANV